MKIAHQLDLTLGIAARSGHAEKMSLAAAVITAEAAVEKAERGHNLKRVALLKPRHRIAARHALGPLVQIVLGVRHDDGRTGRAGGLMELHKFPAIDAVHFKRIGIAEIVLGEKRKFRKIVQRFDIFRRRYALYGEPLAVKVVAPDSAKGFLKPLQLQSGQFIAGQRFSSSVPHSHFQLRFFLCLKNQLNDL